MTPAELARIREWDARCTAPEGMMFGTTIDRRRLLEYVDELEATIAKITRLQGALTPLQVQPYVCEHDWAEVDAYPYREMKCTKCGRSMTP